MFNGILLQFWRSNSRYFLVGISMYCVSGVALYFQGSMSRFLMAYRMSSASEPSLSLRMIRARWVSTVFGLVPVRVATSLLLLPSESNCRISRSLDVSACAEGAFALFTYRSSRNSEMRASKNGLCLARYETASIKSRAAVDFVR
jgi:hypothetical protein